MDGISRAWFNLPGHRVTLLPVASLLAVLLEMRCIEPPGVNPLQRIQESAAQQDTALNGKRKLFR